MGDEQQPHTFAVFELCQQFKNLSLNGHIERGRRLVRDQNVRFVGQSHRDHHPLALATGQLVRICAQTAFRLVDANLCQQFNDPVAGGLADKALMQFDGFGQLLFKRMQRVQRCHRLLKDKADVIAPDLAQQCVGCPNHLLAFVGHRPANNSTIAQQGHRRQGRDRLARSGFTHQCDCFPSAERERHPLDRLAYLAILPKPDGQVFDL